MLPGSNRKVQKILGISYWLLLVYGTLYPFAGWRIPQDSTLFSRLLPSSVGLPDIVLNFWVYAPLGFIWAGYWGARLTNPVGRVLLLAGMTSLTLELLQHFLPGRNTSGLDLLLNIAGALIGATARRFMGTDTGIGRSLAHIRSAWIARSADHYLAVLIIGLWIFLELAPFVPTLDVGGLKSGIKPVYQAIRDPSLLQPATVLIAFFELFTLTVILWTIIRPTRFTTHTVGLLLMCVLIVQVPIVRQQLQPEPLIGLAAALVAFALVRRFASARLTWIAMLCVIAAYVLAESVSPMRSSQLHPFNWQPFAQQIRHRFGLIDIVEQMWPFIVLAYLLRNAAVHLARAHVFHIGLVLVVVLSAGMEWKQLAIPGRHPDVTDIILAALGWLLGWALPRNGETSEGDTETAALASVRTRSLYGFLAVLSLSLGTAIVHDISRADPGGDLYPNRIPAPEEMPRTELPDFRTAHPRLPYPPDSDLMRIRKRNTPYIDGLIAAAANARHRHERVHAAIYSEILRPGSQDIDALHDQLLELQPRRRGHQQTLPLALAYDWLHSRWSPAQREALLQRTIQACDYQIRYIRENQLSPYNVYLYNSPLQALMACAISVYGDSPEAGRVMRFTQTYWKRYVIPVWQQVMGNNGGWHEGGEYVAIGIGKAVYRLPNMWRHATGEDLFSRIPGLRGFLDFAVYRKRPDGRDIHIGDGGHHDKPIPDLHALAIEYGHAAAYSLYGSCPDAGAPRPLSWPWGPLPHEELCDPDARRDLPLWKYFDGIGLLITRSGWDEDSTYISFKAGDNYWSHTHLDQGSFTIFKSGPLAVDSGVYGPRYGSDHHFNYSYQTIAHNTLTITDPDDDLPLPVSDHSDREIANDGGQRRVGSGWGRPAPISLDAWMDEYAIYNTADDVRIHNDSDVSVAIADLTPAYTNAMSGKDTFAHRTRRVEQARRVFIHDRNMEAVIVFDRVRSTDPAFRKRWLLHSLNQPQITDSTFKLLVQPRGSLHGRALLPDPHAVRAVGGPGREFLVNGINYDEDGMLRSHVRDAGKSTEFGTWRLELIPGNPGSLDHFLVAMFPRSQHEGIDLPRTRIERRKGEIVLTVGRTGERSEWRLSDDAARVGYTHIVSGQEHAAVTIR